LNSLVKLVFDRAIGWQPVRFATSLSPYDQQAG
jgi:hypothetical protein